MFQKNHKKKKKKMVQPPLIAPKSAWATSFPKLNKFIKTYKRLWRYDRYQYIQRYSLCGIMYASIMYVAYGTNIPYMMMVTADPNEILKNPYFEKEYLEGRKQKEMRDEELRRRAEPLLRQ